MKPKKILEKIRENVIQGRREMNDIGFSETDSEGRPFKGQPAVKELMEQALKLGVNSNDLAETLAKGMKTSVEKFESLEYSIPDMLASSRALDSASEILRPFLKKKRRKNQIVVILATVKGDIHFIGKKIVELVLRGQEMEVIDIGVDVPEEEIIEKIRREKPHVLGLSAMLTTTMDPGMKNVIKRLEEDGLRSSVKVIIGGAPLSKGFAEEIGADGYAPNAFAGAELIRTLLGAKK